MKAPGQHSCPACRGLKGFKIACTICLGTGIVSDVERGDLIEIHPILANGAMDREHFTTVHSSAGGWPMPKKGCITTFSGIAFDLANPTPDMICIEDIAHHLAMVCRWAGATSSFFSVAQHCVLVSKVCSPELRQWALLHDAAEAYIGDLTRPLKAILRADVGALSSIDILEHGIMLAVATKFNLPWPEPAGILKYDDQIQKIEGQMFIRHDGQFHNRDGDVAEIHDLDPGVSLPQPMLIPMIPQAAEQMFLTRYRRLFLDDDGL